ncbi:Uma2 family endonuclease [Streptomyces pseudogriseolus]|uniref:Uma2 family endonuclease n=1 Tax=Streptomyces pseudogriseolus TaxID=36817 RepID=UPI001CE2B4E5|nr:Uma2 family endonuclease [Streptomyces pseudogriseolus]
MPVEAVRGYDEKLADYPAMGIPHYMIVHPRTGTIEVHSGARPAFGPLQRVDEFDEASLAEDEGHPVRGLSSRERLAPHHDRLRHLRRAGVRVFLSHGA